MIHEYFPGMKTIGGFARITDIAMESDEEIRQGNWGRRAKRKNTVKYARSWRGNISLNVRAYPLNAPFEFILSFSVAGYRFNNIRLY